MTLTKRSLFSKAGVGFNLYDSDYKESGADDPLTLVDHPKASYQCAKNCLRRSLLWEPPVSPPPAGTEPWRILRVRAETPVISSNGCLINGDVLGIHPHTLCLTHSEELVPLSQLVTPLHAHLLAGITDVQR
ncbi:hypothetical protein AB4Y63_18000 [Leifsonia sp. YAF41]|uniref:hypothetical protein n=1 Tax=Leifsonia sp. YAF41 TaxID=3233086 RepID=UPI003F9CE7A2